jgi:hypothetical protein
MNKQQQENNALDQTDLLCAIFDNVAYHYEPPFVEKNKGTAVRRIQDLIQQNPNSPYAKFPDNFSLCHIGYYDSSDGSILDLESTEIMPLTEITNKE